MTIVIDQHSAAAFAINLSQRIFTEKIKATAGSLKLSSARRIALSSMPSSVATATAAAARSRYDDWRIQGHLQHLFILTNRGSGPGANLTIILYAHVGIR